MIHAGKILVIRWDWDVFSWSSTWSSCWRTSRKSGGCTFWITTCATLLQICLWQHSDIPGTGADCLKQPLSIFRNMGMTGFFLKQCVQKGPQLRTWSSWGPNCQNCPHLVLILYKRPHLPQFWYILGIESVFLYYKWRNIEISSSILLYMDLLGMGYTKVVP